MLNIMLPTKEKTKTLDDLVRCAPENAHRIAAASDWRYNARGKSLPEA